MAASFCSTMSVLGTPLDNTPMDSSGDNMDDDLSSVSSLSSDNTMERTMDATVNTAIESTHAKCYLLDNKPYRTDYSTSIFKRDLHEKDDPEMRQPPWLNEEECLENYCMHQESIRKLVELTKCHPIFRSTNNKKQATMEHQLMVFLRYLGHPGSRESNPCLQDMFLIGHVTAEKSKY